ncbi:MAG: TolC family protein [Bacteroidetes bacterium]|nr:TolC family protein [Bacteroidota bacterium]
MLRKHIAAAIIISLTFSIPVSAQQDSIWTLEECIQFALDQNIQVRKSENSTSRSQLYYDQSKAQRFPSVNGSANQNFGWSRNSTSGVSGYSFATGSGYSVSSGVTLYNGSRLSNQIKQSQLDIRSSEYQLETTKEGISLNILDAFLQVLYSEEQVKNSNKQIESTEEQLRLAGERLNLKVISVADYSQVRSQLANEKLTLANSEKQYAIARVTLMQLMELPSVNNFEIAHPDMDTLLFGKRIPDVWKVYETALTIKPQIKSASLNKEIAGLDEKIARAGYFPSLTASAGISTGFSSEANGAYSNQLNDGLYPTAGLSLSIPIYQKKQVKTTVEVAKLSYSDAELTELDTRNQLRKNIEQACLDVTSAQVEYEASIENFQATLESTSLAEEKFIQGLINSVDYLVSKTNLIYAESKLLQSKYNLIFSYKVLDFYEGVPLSFQTIKK